MDYPIILGGVQGYGEMYIANNSTVTTINASDEWHAIDGILLGGFTEGFTYESGSNGVIASIADAGGGDITVGDVAHGLSTGDVVTINDCSDSAYNGVFIVQSVPTADTFTVTAVYTATDIGYWQKGASLTCDAGYGGNYVGQWASSGTSANTGHVFDYSPCINTTISTKAKSRRKFSNTDFGSFSGCGVMTINAGDKITFVTQNVGASGNLTIRTLDLNIHKL